jgi:hypothetical protein
VTNTQTINFINADSLIPEDWDWFWDEFSEYTSACFGTNIVSIIRKEDFADVAWDVISDYLTEAEAEAFSEKVKALPENFVNIENSHKLL